MSGQRVCGDKAPALRCGHAAEHGLARGAARTGALLLIGVALGFLPTSALAGSTGDSPRAGARGTLAPQASAVLLDFYQAFLRDQDVERYRRQVASRYTELMLARVAETASIDARRAAVLALGLMGTFESTNAALARCLRDADPTVRSLAEDSLWAIWLRADTPENNDALKHIRTLMRGERLDEALPLVDKLVARAPRFAEAYNQRAIIYYALHRFEDSAADCERVLQLNPYHFGALNGLAGCQYRLDKRGDALKTMRRALKLQPFNEGLRESIAALEASGK